MCNFCGNNYYNGWNNYFLKSSKEISTAGYGPPLFLQLTIIQDLFVLLHEIEFA